MSTRRQELLAAVLAEPSRENCAVYADHLLELGDPRGELIATEIAIADCVSPRLRRRLQWQRKQLLREHREQWWPYGFAPGQKDPELSVADTRFGFLQQIKMPATRFLRLAAPLLAAEPIRELELLDATRLPIAALGPGRLTRLTLGAALSPASFDELVSSPRLDALRELWVYIWTGSNVRLSRLRLPALESLHLVGRGFSLGRGVELVDWPRLPSLRRLALVNCQVTLPVLERLLTVASFPALEELDLRHNPIGHIGVRLLCEHAASFPALRRLLLVGTGFGDEGALALHRTSWPAGLELLEIA